MKTVRFQRRKEKICSDVNAVRDIFEKGLTRKKEGLRRVATKIERVDYIKQIQ